MTSVFVTGATGTVGSAVVDHLSAQGQHVIAGLRRDADTLPHGVTPRHFDIDMSRSELRTVFHGADRLFLMRPPHIDDVATHLFPVIQAAQRLLGLGIPHCPTCLELLGIAGSDEHPYYRCSSCQLPRILP